MNASNTIQTGPGTDSFKMLRAMVGIGILCALLIVLTYEGTLPVIEKNKAEALEKAIFKVVPGMTSKRAFRLTENGQLAALGPEEEAEQLIYAGYNEDGQLVGVAVEASGMGFADILRILYGYDPKAEQVVGFYVLESKETPGLGDKIEKDAAFLANFKALDVALAVDGNQLQNPVVPVKSGDKENAWEVDCITGATISSRAIGNIIGTSTAEWVPLIHKQQETLE